VTGTVFAGGVALNPRPNVVPACRSNSLARISWRQNLNGAAFLRRLKDRRETAAGNFGRNVLRGFGATQADVGLQPAISLDEKLGLRFRSEFFNIFQPPKLRQSQQQPGRLSAKL